jgi:hypothetical protein
MGSLLFLPRPPEQYDEGIDYNSSVIAPPPPYLGLLYGRFLFGQTFERDAIVPASPPGYAATYTLLRVPDPYRFAPNVTVRHAAAAAAGIVGLRPKSFALACELYWPRTPSHPANCTVRVTGRYSSRHNSLGNGHGKGKPTAPATYGPFDLTIMGGQMLNPRVEWWATNMTRFTLPPLAPGGMLTDLQWDIVNITGEAPDYGSIAMDDFAYDLVSAKGRGK